MQSWETTWTPLNNRFISVFRNRCVSSLINWSSIIIVILTFSVIGHLFTLGPELYIYIYNLQRSGLFHIWGVIVEHIAGSKKLQIKPFVWLETVQKKQYDYQTASGENHLVVFHTVFIWSSKWAYNIYLCVSEWVLRTSYGGETGFLYTNFGKIMRLNFEKSLYLRACYTTYDV